MNQLELTQFYLPEDISLKIISSLEVSDVCSLGCCSKFWRELCRSDFLWESLCRERWPSLAFNKPSSIPQGWKSFYISKHNEMACKATNVVNFAWQHLSSESIEVGHYLAMIQDLRSMQFGFKDVKMFFLKPKLHVLLNLVGLHYCISWLEVPVEHLLEALISCNISERKVSVQWWKLGRWNYGFRMQDESHSRNVLLGDLAIAKEDEVLGVLHRGAIHEVLRIQISASKPTCIPWLCQIAATQA